MQPIDIVFRGRVERRRYDYLAQKDMALSIYYDGPTMDRLGILDGILFMFNQLG